MGFNLGSILGGAAAGFLSGGPGGAIAGAVGGALAKPPGKPKSIANSYYDKAFSEAMKIYDQTDVAANDELAMAEYEKGANKKGMQLLTDYDALAAGAGSSIGKADTNKDLSRASIASAVSRDASAKKAELILTRASRKRALLPGLDQPSSLGLQTRPGNADSLMMLGGAVPWNDIFKKKGKSGGSTGGSDASTEY